MSEIPNLVDVIPEAPTDLILRLRRELSRVLADADLVIARRMTAAQAPRPSPDRAVGLEEAAGMLGMSKAWLQRKANWERVGGYRDADRRIKFSLATLQDHIRGRR